ncbi:MAG: tRNA 4-thiouridine(8) synthase ThiI [Patescibacteria group bacterium]|nr:tRNA 4-thiouridine(8) synthase ThiI [Patescibacteria group bacterium]
MYDAIIIHVGELVLKGGNRGRFEQCLITNLHRQLEGLGVFKMAMRQASLVMTPASGPIDAEQAEKIRRRLRAVFGIAKFMFVKKTPRDIEAMGAAAATIAAASGAATFKVITRRSDKTFPHPSMEVSRLVGAAVLDAVPGIKVDVHEPKMELRVEIASRAAYVSPGLENGAGGLPVGSSGRVVALLSGGIDSPVAAWKALKRGCEVIYVHFHSYPFVDRRSVEKARRLAEALAPWQPDAKMYLVPFGEFQREVVAKCDPSMRIVLYRRMMVRMAEVIARREGALGIFTGDSIGQVASQTLENLETVTAAAKLPIYRPLVGDDKEEIITFAKRIGTYAIAIEPHDDCCSLFMPPRPATKATVARAEAEEARLDIGRFQDEMLTQAELVTIGYNQ